MPSRPQVRNAQRTLAALDAAHSRAVARLDQALARRAELVAEQDRHVARAQVCVDQAVVAMANEVSADLAAQLLDLPVSAVRRLIRASATMQNTSNGGVR